MKEDNSANENKSDISPDVSCSETEDEILLTHRETAEILRVTTNTLYRWNRLKKGPPCTRVGVGKVLYNKKDVLKYLQNCKQ